MLLKENYAVLNFTAKEINGFWSMLDDCQITIKKPDSCLC